MSRAKGDIAEAQAYQYLQSLGFIMIETNVYSRFGEIDIIATKDSVLHFIEVKSARSIELALQNLTPSKLKKIIKTSNVYMKKNCVESDYCYDAVIIAENKIELIENITL
jgi:putative endonuclease